MLAPKTGSAGLLSCIAAMGAMLLAAPANAENQRVPLTRAAPPTPALSTPSVPTLPGTRAADTGTASSATDPQDRFDAALKRVAAAAIKGDHRAQLELGRSYRTGKGAPVDRQEALRWLTVAARANLPAAHYQLGLLHVSGVDGRQPDLVEAYARFKFASDEGDVRAAALVFYIGARMTAEEMRAAQERLAELRRLSHLAKEDRPASTATPPTSATPPPASPSAETK